MAQYGRYWKVHFAKKTRGAWHSVKYLGRYLKRPPVSASRLRHYGGRGGPPLPRSPHGEA
nr:transposase [Klebsiella pneumoniae]